MFGYLKIHERLEILFITVIFFIPIWFLINWLAKVDVSLISFMVGGAFYQLIDGIVGYIRFKKIEW